MLSQPQEGYGIVNHSV
uniref:Uncharacterized protein n=1 Tax=Arundo donax TaxID=35708 RepID=A0A0A8YDG9_ARUDO